MPEQMPGHVYLIYAPGRVKIGYSTNWASRVRHIINMAGAIAEPLMVIPGDRDLETAMHKRFKPLRLTGEWFKYDGDLKAWIERVGSDLCKSQIRAIDNGALCVSYWADRDGVE